jgi:hypothetical protein
MSNYQSAIKSTFEKKTEHEVCDNSNFMSKEHKTLLHRARKDASSKATGYAKLDAVGPNTGKILLNRMRIIPRLLEDSLVGVGSRTKRTCIRSIRSLNARVDFLTVQTEKQSHQHQPNKPNLA